MQQGNSWLRTVVSPPSIEEVRAAAEGGGTVRVAYANGSSVPHALTIRDIELTSRGFTGIDCAGGARVEVFYDPGAGTARVDLSRIVFDQQIQGARGA